MPYKWPSQIVVMALKTDCCLTTAGWWVLGSSWRSGVLQWPSTLQMQAMFSEPETKTMKRDDMLLVPKRAVMTSRSARLSVCRRSVWDDGSCRETGKIRQCAEMKRFLSISQQRGATRSERSKYHNKSVHSRNQRCPLETFWNVSDLLPGLPRSRTVSNAYACVARVRHYFLSSAQHCSELNTQHRCNLFNTLFQEKIDRSAPFRTTACAWRLPCPTRSIAP